MSFCVRISPSSPILVPLFVLFMGLAGIVLCNLMVAIVVKNAFDSVEADEEMVAKIKEQKKAK